MGDLEKGINGDMEKGRNGEIEMKRPGAKGDSYHPRVQSRVW
jgi:hypothetical protein